MVRNIEYCKLFPIRRRNRRDDKQEYFVLIIIKSEMNWNVKSKRATYFRFLSASFLRTSQSLLHSIACLWAILISILSSLEPPSPRRLSTLRASDSASRARSSASLQRFSASNVSFSDRALKRADEYSYCLEMEICLKIQSNIIIIMNSSMNLGSEKSDRITEKYELGRVGIS